MDASTISPGNLLLFCYPLYSILSVYSICAYCSSYAYADDVLAVLAVLAVISVLKPTDAMILSIHAFSCYAYACVILVGSMC
jgi:hypothetical protein